MDDEQPRLRVLIVDDEPPARAVLKKLLSEDEGVEIVGECADGARALAEVRSSRPDLMFLDVRMPGMGGLEVLEALGETGCPAVVFTTAYDRYALEAFERNAVDYLLKPFDDERFRVALARAKERIRRERLEGIGKRIAGLMASAGSPEQADGPADDRPGGPAREPLSKLRIHRDRSIELVDVDEVVWFQAADQYVRVHTSGGEILMRQSMGELERTLDPARFVRVHRSAIVALDRIRRLESRGGGSGDLFLHDGTRIPVSRSRVSGLRRRLG